MIKKEMLNISTVQRVRGKIVKRLTYGELVNKLGYNIRSRYPELQEAISQCTNISHQKDGVQSVRMVSCEIGLDVNRLFWTVEVIKGVIKA